jgi:hypothetical protein
MSISAADRREHAGTLFAKPEIVADRRADGSIWLRSTMPLQQDARCVGDWLEHWARQKPEKIFLGERAGLDTPWNCCLQGRAAAGALGSGLDSGARFERRAPAGHSLR